MLTDQFTHVFCDACEDDVQLVAPDDEEACITCPDCGYVIALFSVKSTR